MTLVWKIEFSVRSVEPDHLEPVKREVSILPSGTGAEGRGNSDDSHRNVGRGTDDRHAGRGRCAGNFRLAVYTSQSNRVRRTCALFLARQRDEKKDHEDDPHNACQTGLQ